MNSSLKSAPTLGVFVAREPPADDIARTGSSELAKSDGLYMCRIKGGWEKSKWIFLTQLLSTNEQVDSYLIQHRAQHLEAGRA